MKISWFRAWNRKSVNLKCRQKYFSRSTAKLKYRTKSRQKNKYRKKNLRNWSLIHAPKLMLEKRNLVFSWCYTRNCFFRSKLFIFWTKRKTGRTREKNVSEWWETELKRGYFTWSYTCLFSNEKNSPPDPHQIFLSETFMQIIRRLGLYFWWSLTLIVAY